MFARKINSDSEPLVLQETPQSRGAMDFQSFPWSDRELNRRRNASRNLFVDLLESPSPGAGSSQRFINQPVEVNWYPFFLKMTPENVCPPQMPQAPKKTGNKKFDRSKLQPKKLSYTAEELTPVIPITETYNSVYYNGRDHFFGGSNINKSVRVFHENSNHQNGTPGRTLAGEQARSAKDNVSVVSSETHGEVRSNNKENDSQVSRRVQRSSRAKHNVTHVDSSIALNPIAIESSQTPFDSSWDKVIEWLQPQRDTGLWIECCNKSCRKWRYVEEYHDPSNVPEIWYCSMQQNNALASCDLPEIPSTHEIVKKLIANKYNAGSIVLAHIRGYPWWPAIVCDSPSTLTYYKVHSKSNKPFAYFVVFLDKNVFEHAWIKVRSLKKFVFDREMGLKRWSKAFQDLYGERLKESYELAKKAESLTILERLKKFDYLAWHNRLNNIEEQESSPQERTTQNQQSELVFDSMNMIAANPTATIPKRRRLCFANNIKEQENCSPQEKNTKNQQSELDFDSMNIIPASPTAIIPKRRRLCFAN